MTELLNEKPTLLKYLGLIEEVNVDLGATDKRSPSGELMILSVKGSENSGTLTYGNITDGNQTVSLMELKLSDGTVIDLNGQLEILGWGTETAATPSDPIEKLIADPIVEKAIRSSLKKPEGKLTEADLEKVTDLDLHNTFITDAGLKEVVKLQQLKLLDLFRTQVTDEGLKDLAKLQHLTILILSLTNTTDAGLEDVAKLQKLTRLALEDTNISDASLKNLVKLKRLESLWLYDTNVTKAGAAELQKALPSCEIIGP